MDRLVSPKPLQQVIGYPTDVGLAAVSVITGNTLQRFPKLRLAFSHGGGTLASLLPRLAEGVRAFLALRETIREDVYTQARRLFYDALVYDEATLRHLLATFGDDAVMAAPTTPSTFMSGILSAASSALCRYRRPVQAPGQQCPTLSRPRSSSVSRSPVTEIRSVALGTPNLARSLDFYSNVWSLTEVARLEDTIYLRVTGRDHHVLSLTPHHAPEILTVTFRVADAAELLRLCAAIPAAGGDILTQPHANSAPDGGTVATVRTPEGYLFNLLHGDFVHTDDIRRQGIPYRISHVNLNCVGLDATSTFLQQTLGFRLTDRSKMMAFLSCNHDHHAVVLADSGLNGMNHIAFMMPDTESVMRGSGRMIDNGFPIDWGVGRHGPGDNVFAYFKDPDGFVIEYTAEVAQVDNTWQPHGPNHWVWPPGRTDHWGIAPPKPDSMKRAQLAIPFARST